MLKINMLYRILFFFHNLFCRKVILRIDKKSFFDESSRMAKSALGRGFGALMGDRKAKTSSNNTTVQKTAAGKPEPKTDPASSRDAVLNVPIERVFPSRLQPRKHFIKESLEELTQSIREHGIMQPLIVRKSSDTRYELIAGERRLRAGKAADLKEVPVIIIEADDRKALELMMVENLQRENLNPIDEAIGFEQLIREFKLTQEAAAARVGKGRVVVANALRLLKLPQSVQVMVADGRLSVGHAKAILSLEYIEDMQAMAERVVNGKLSVREVETLVARKLNKTEHSQPKTLPPPNVHLRKVEEKLREHLGTQVKVKSNDGEKGSLEIQFYNKEDLNRLLDILSVSIE